MEVQTMLSERSRATFDISGIEVLLAGGQHAHSLKRRMECLIERDQLLRKPFFFDMSYAENRERTMIQISRAIEILRTLRQEEKAFFIRTLALYDRSLGMRIGVHAYLFRQLVLLQGTDEQIAKWLPAIDDYRVIGCFSMTELGHSSALRGIETTATYDRATQEFIIDSPTITSTKWWIGMAGQTATHTAVLAQLVLDNEKKGLHWFIVQLRDTKTGKLLPGVTAGHLGAKAGRHGLDNGWIQFSGVRIPLDNMLMRWGSVTPSGEYNPVPIAATAYATLVGERIWTLEEVFNVVGQAVTIAIRYGVVRRQGPNNEQIIDYQTQQIALMPILAQVYCVRLLWHFMDKSWNSILSQQAGPNADPHIFLMHMADYHALVSGQKAWFGWMGADHLELIRRCIGGHAYSSYNAIADLIADFGVFTTGAGDNYVLAQQCARYLISQFKRVKEGKTPAKSTAFLAEPTSTLDNLHCSAEMLSDSNFHIATLKCLATKLLSNTANKLAAYQAAGHSFHEAWNKHMDRLIECTRPYVYLHALQVVLNVINSEDKLDERQKAILKKIVQIFGLYHLRTMSEQLLMTGCLSVAVVDLLREELANMCNQLREQCIPLTDALGFPDWILKAPIGRADGDIYTSYLAQVKAGAEYQDRNYTSVGGLNTIWAQHIAPTIGHSKL